MPKVVLCQDGIEAHLEHEEGLWIVLHDRSDGALARFVIDLSELRAIRSGAVSYQATDGEGASVSIEGADGSLKVRLEVRGKGTKQCRLASKTVAEAIESLRLDV